MMFLQFFVWGAWYTSIAVYMTNHGMEKLTHWPYTVNPIAAIVAPFFLGLVADRYFATEKVLGVLHLLGGVVMFAVPQATGAPAAFILLLLVYNLCYMPTLGLANSLAFHHIQSQEQQFPLIRVFGTIGWIVAGLSIDFVLGPMLGSGPVPEQTALPIYTTAAASVLLGLFAFSLPHTPPPGAGQRVSLRSILGLDALAQLGDRPFYVFIAASLLLCIPLAAYYNFTQIFLGNAGITKIQATQSLGQMSEVIFMLLMPVFFVRLGVKRMLMVGMAAWVVRYALLRWRRPVPSCRSSSSRSCSTACATTSFSSPVRSTWTRNRHPRFAARRRDSSCWSPTASVCSSARRWRATCTTGSWAERPDCTRSVG